MQLDPEQQQVVDCTGGALLVLAPVGTGKTTVLAHRLARAIERGIEPRRALCLTFTNRAAQEMRERLVRLYPDAARQVTVRTFHTLCATMLRQEARNLGLAPDFSIADEQDCLELVHEIFKLDKNERAHDLLNGMQTAKSHADELQAPYATDWETLFASCLPPQHLAAACRYQKRLQAGGALDFADLVYTVRYLLHAAPPELRAKWADRYDFMQVDEVQDTHASEYDVVAILADRHRNLALIGDVDQTIYAWRGSEPDRLLRLFRRDFAPREFALVTNYRATIILLETASRFAQTLANRRTRIVPVQGAKPGQPIVLHGSASEPAEAAWIAGEVARCAAAGTSYGRIAVLTRKNLRNVVVAEALEQAKVPCVPVEEYEFFQRQEVKDALAYLRVVAGQSGADAVRRLLLRPGHGIGEVTIRKFSEGGAACGLKLGDLLCPMTLDQGDPLLPLSKSLGGGRVVVFDTESTGLATSRDEVVELAALELNAGVPGRRTHRFIRNTVPVADSEPIHGWSDAYLQEHGEPAADVFRDFAGFCAGAVLVGHNVEFDARLVRSHARRSGVEWRPESTFDTFDLGRRALPGLGDFRLGSLAAHYGINAERAHHATDDVATTAGLLKHLAGHLESGSRKRMKLVAEHGAGFRKLAASMAGWRERAGTLRPAALLEAVIKESGLLDYYRNRHEERRVLNLRELWRVLQQRDSTEQGPEEALLNALEFAALSRNIDYLAAEDPRVRVMTMHQSKGLEFDVVFIAGASDSEMPNYFALREGRVEEEKRLFYVALTRARERLFASWHERTNKGRTCKRSPFVDALAVKGPPAPAAREIRG